MTRNEIIETLFNGKNFRDCIGKMEPAHLREDLMMEVALVVCEWQDDKVVALHAEGKLEFYVVRVIINMLSNKYSAFHKKYRQKLVPIDSRVKILWHTKLKEDATDRPEVNIPITDEAELEARADREIREDQAIAEIDNLYWYNKGLVKLYLQHGNYRAIEKETGIPFISCYKTIQKSFRELKLKISV